MQEIQRSDFIGISPVILLQSRMIYAIILYKTDTSMKYSSNA